MLPSDSKACQNADKECFTQTLVEDHYYKVQMPEEKPVTYSDELFC